MSSTIHFPFGAKDIKTVSPNQNNVVALEVANIKTFVKVTKLGANTTINVTPSDNLPVGATLIVSTFNIVGETHDTIFGDGFYGKTIDGVSNMAHYATFMFDGKKFVQTGTQETTRDELETVSASMEITVDGNEITWVTTYTNPTHVSDDYVLDVKLTTSKPMPVGATIELTGLTGDYEVEGTPQSVFWLSDVMKAHDGDPSTRGLLNLHTAPITFIGTISGLTEDMDITLWTELVTSNKVATGTQNADAPMTEFVVLDSAATALSLDADE